MSRDVIIEVRGDLADVNRKIAKLDRKFTDTKKAGTRAFDAINKSLSVLGSAAVAAAGAAGLGYLVKRNLEAADAIGKTADKIGLTTDKLQEYQYAGKLAGVNQRTLNMALQRFSRRMGEAAEGTGEALKTVDKYNVRVRDSNGNMRTNTEILKDWADVIKNAESDQERLRIAFKLFDSEGAAVINMLKDGSGALEDMMAEARELGLVMDRGLIDKATRANDELTKLAAVLKTRFTITAAELAPYIADIAEDMNDWVKANQDLLTQDIPNFLGGVAGAAAAVADNYERIAAAARLVAAMQGHAVNPFPEQTQALNEFVSRNVHREPGKPKRFPMPEPPSVEPELSPGATAQYQYAPAVEAQKAFEGTLAQESRLDKALGTAPNELNDMRLGRAQTEMADEAARAESEALAEQQQKLNELVAAEQERFNQAIDGQGRLEEALIASEGRISQMRWERLQTEKTADQERLESAMQVAQGMGAISQLTARLSADGNETMFAISKAAGYAQAIISVWTGAAKALELPFPANLAAMAQVIATGMGLVTSIQSQEMPSYDQGGISTAPGMYYAGVPEAHIPLQGGKVPVDIGGGPGGSTYHVTINAMDAASFAQLVERNPGAITTVVERQIRGNQKLRHTMRKYG